MDKALLAIDVGGSTSRACIADLSGRCLGRGQSRGGNPASNDRDLAASSMIAAAEAAIAAAGGGPLEILVAQIALAGPPAHVPLARLETAFRALGLTGPVVLAGDLLAMFASITPAVDGYCVVAGTGAGAVRIRSGAIERAVDAIGWLLGDFGSGYWLGLEAARAVAADLDGRGEATSLASAMLAKLGIAPSDDHVRGRPANLRKLIDAIYALRPIELAQFAPLVFAHRADPIAARLIGKAERYLIADFAMVFEPAAPGPIALGGGVMPHLGGVSRGIAEIVRAAGHMPVIRPVADGSSGAVVLAMRAIGLVVDESVFAVIAESIGAENGA